MDISAEEVPETAAPEMIVLEKQSQKATQKQNVDFFGLALHWPLARAFGACVEIIRRRFAPKAGVERPCP